MSLTHTGQMWVGTGNSSLGSCKSQRPTHTLVFADPPASPDRGEPAAAPGREEQQATPLG